jgi:hypothetical protein
VQFIVVVCYIFIIVSTNKMLDFKSFIIVFLSFYFVGVCVVCGVSVC